MEKWINENFTEKMIQQIENIIIETKRNFNLYFIEHFNIILEHILIRLSKLKGNFFKLFY
jgi:hypothetical protein